MRYTTTAALLAAATTLSGCAAASSAAPAATPTATASAALAAAPGSPTPVPAPQTANLPLGLLTVGDLPGTWHQVTPPAGQPIGPARLLPLPTGALPSDAARLDRAQFAAAGPDGSDLSEELSTYPSRSAAAAAVAQISTVLGTHPNWLVSGDRRMQVRPAPTPGPLVHGWHLSVSDAHGAGGADDGVDTPTIEQTYLYAAVGTHLLVTHLAGPAAQSADTVDAAALALWRRAAAKVGGQPVSGPVPTPQVTSQPTATASVTVAPVLP